MPRRPVPRDGVQRPRLRGRARRLLAVERRRDPVPGRASRTSRSASPGSRPGRRRRAWTRRPRRARSAPPAAACGCGACTCPTAARSPTRTYTTSSTGWPPCAPPPPAGWPTTPAAQVALVGDWNIAPENDDVWDMAVFAHSTHVSPPERAAFRADRRRRVTPTSSARTRPGPGVYTYWDYTQLRFPRREGMRIDFVLGSPALAAPGDRRPASTARSARARAPATTPRSIVDLGGLNGCLVLLLLPPSETKHPGGDGAPLDLAALTRPGAHRRAHRARRGAGQAGRRRPGRPRRARPVPEAGRRDRAQRRALDQPHPAGARALHRRPLRRPRRRAR